MHERRSKVKKELDDPSHPNESKLNSSREREPLIPKTGRTSCPDVLGRDGPTVPGQLLCSKRRDEVSDGWESWTRGTTLNWAKSSVVSSDGMLTVIRQGGMGRRIVGYL